MTAIPDRLDRRVVRWGLAVLPVAILQLPLIPIAAGAGTLWTAITAAIATILVLPIVWVQLGRPAPLVVVAIGWLWIHKIVAAGAAVAISPAANLWISYSKELLLLAVGAVAGAAAVPAAWRWLRRVRVTSRIRLPRPLLVADVAAIAILAIVAVALLVSDTPVTDRLLAARRFAFPPFLYLAGRLLVASRTTIEAAIRGVVAVGVGVAGFGLFERLVLGDRFWRDVMHVGSYVDTIIDAGLLPGRAYLTAGLPANWSVYIGDSRFTRLVSTFLEPTTLGLALALVICLAWLTTRSVRARALLIAVLGIAMLLTFGKGGLLVVVVVAAVVALGTTKRSAIRDLAAVAILGLVLVGIGLLLPLNVPAHLADLFSGLSATVDRPLGRGLGATGYWGVLYRIGGDSTIGNLGSQLGVLGLIAWTTWSLGVSWSLLPRRSGTDLASLGRLIGAATFALFLVGWVSNSTSGLLASAAYFLLGGWATSVLAAVPEDLGERRGLVIAWTPESRRSRTLGSRLGADVVLLSRWGYRRPWSAPLAYPVLAVRTVLAILGRDPAWVLVVAPPVVAPLAALVACRIRGIRLAIDVHSGALLDRRWRWSQRLLAWTVRRAGTAVVTLPSLRGRIAAPPDTVLVVPDPLPELGPGAPIAADGAAADDGADAEGAPLVVAICGWGADEPIAELLSAAAALPVRLVLTGRPRQAPALPPNARLSGFLPDAAFVGLVRSASVVVVLTTRDDTLLSGVWEGLAAGRPIVTSDTAAIRATFGADLTLVESDADAIRAGIGAVLANPDAATARSAAVATRFRAANDAALVELAGRLVAVHRRTSDVPPLAATDPAGSSR